MVVTFIAWPGFVRMLYLIVLVGIRRLARTCTSSIRFCCPSDRAGVAARNVQKIRKGVPPAEGAPEKAAIVVSLTVCETKGFARRHYVFPPILQRQSNETAWTNCALFV